MLILAMLLVAHDHYLEPVATATAGWVVRHRVGEGLDQPEEKPWDRAKVAIATFGRQDLLRDDRPTGPPALVLGAGTGVLRVDRIPIDITLEGPKFREYLREEGLDETLARRRIEVDFGKPARERYRRYLKAIIDAPLVHAPLGQRLEIVPLSEPDGELELRVLFDGAPLSGAVVFAETHTSEPQRRTTNTDGTARFTVARAGFWLVRLVHMKRCTKDCGPAEWESHWAALTFRTKEPSMDAALARVEQSHGGAGPWAVAGYRMGIAALEHLALKPGSFDLEVAHRSPRSVQYSCLADGAAAATGASLGKLNLSWSEVPRAALATEYRRRSSGAKVVLRPTAAFEARFKDVPRAKLLEAGREVMTLKDSEIFEMVPQP